MLPAPSVRSLSDGKIFPTEVEGNCGEAARFPVRVAYWNQPAEQTGILPEKKQT
jgi:hypothetical protein